MSRATTRTRGAARGLLFLMQQLAASLLLLLSASASAAAATAGASQLVAVYALTSPGASAQQQGGGDAPLLAEGVAQCYAAGELAPFSLFLSHLHGINVTDTNARPRWESRGESPARRRLQHRRRTPTHNTNNNTKKNKAPPFARATC